MQSPQPNEPVESEATSALGELSDTSSRRRLAAAKERACRAIGATRASMRPSAFGLPAVRNSGASGAVSGERSVVDTLPAACDEDDELDEPTVKRAAPTFAPEPHDAKPVVAAVKADIEQLLPISQVTKSLPQPPRMVALELPSTSPRARRFPLGSIAVFALMLAASSYTLSRYSAFGASAPRPASEPGVLVSTANGPGASELEQTIDEGERVLAADPAGAASLFARASALAGSDDARAEHGLARARLMQGDLPGAEQSLRRAIAKRPRDTSLHVLLSDVLEREGRVEEAAHARELARDLANFAGPMQQR